MKDSRDIIAKADLAVANLISDGGYLNSEQANNFIDIVINQPTLLQTVRTVRMNAPKRKIEKIGFGNRILRAAPASGTALAEARRARPDLDMIELEIDISMAGELKAGAAMGSGYRPMLRSMQVKLTDNSINQRIVKYCTELGLTSAQILRAHINALQYAGNTVGIKFDKHVIDPYKEYLTDKSTFVATAKPREPVYLTRISRYKPSDVPALLNLEAFAH